MIKTTSQHYDDSYFRYQAPIGEFGGWANRTKFAEFVQPNFNVVDFGCGGGYLLQQFDCSGKIGVEINAAARDNARDNGIETVATVDELKDEWADLVVSNHALEHVAHPLKELEGLRPKLKTGGLLVFVVPCEGVRCQYQPNDKNRHLHSWSPMCLGNLFNEAGYDVAESKPYLHKWPRKRYRTVARIGGRFGFDLYCRIYGRLSTSLSQVRVVARKS